MRPSGNDADGYSDTVRCHRSIPVTGREEPYPRTAHSPTMPFIRENRIGRGLINRVRDIRPRCHPRAGMTELYNVLLLNVGVSNYIQVRGTTVIYETMRISKRVWTAYP